MDYKYQDSILLNDIINRNYYWYFKRQDNQKDICLTFYYNNRYNNTNIIPNFPNPKSNIEKILYHLNLFLNFYIQNEFNCNIKINDELWLTDLKERDKIINIFIDKFSNSSFKPSTIIINSNIIHCLDDKYKWFEDIKNKFKNININIQFIFETSLIDIVDVRYIYKIKDFLLKNCTKLKIKINPNNLVYFMEIFNNIYQNFSSILYLYEEDNVNWTDFKINEYIEFLDQYIDLIYNESKTSYNLLDRLFKDENLSLISLKNNGTLDNSNAKSKCSFYKSLNILLEDLTINLCPKFQYDDQIIGQYRYENNKITKIEPKYLGLISMNIHLKKSSTPHCETCPFVVFCQGFCCKESYKLCLNPIIPIRESCELKRSKYAFIFYKLNYLNILTQENILQINDIPIFYKDYINNLLDNIIGGIK